MDFLNFFVEMFVDSFRMFGNSPMDTIMAILMAIALILIAFLVLIILYGLFRAIDSWFLPYKRAIGRVVEKEFTPEHTTQTMVYSAATKTTMPMPLYHPDDWSLTVEVDGDQDSISVEEEFYNSVEEGSEVVAWYVTGRFSGAFYLRDLEHQE